MLVDVFITTKGRPDLLEKSLRSFEECTDPADYRLTIIDDTGDMGRGVDIVLGMADGMPRVDHLLVHRENLGLGPSINQVLAHIDALQKWDGEDGFICYCQDDVLYSKGWLQKLLKMFLLNQVCFPIGFASGIECVEHPVIRDIGAGLVLKDWIRATNMFGKTSFWMSMFPIPKFDVETGRERAKPNDGVGSGVDWHFIRDHENSVCRTGKTCLVIPGLLQHMGYDRSTWLDRKLPESEKDIGMISSSR